MFPNLADALDVKNAPKIATTCIIKILDISPNVLASAPPQAISSSPK